MNLLVSWAAVAGATSYNLFRDLSLGGSYVQQVYAGVSLSFMDSNLTPGTIYYYKVSSSGPGGTSSLSAVLTVTLPVNNQPVRSTSMRQAVARSGVQFEFANGLLDAQAMEWEYGQPVILHIRGESNVTRDDYGSIIDRKTDTVTMIQNAATIDYQPNKYQMEKAGLRQECGATVWIAMQDFIDKGLDFDDIETKRMTIDIMATPGESNGTAYEVTEKSRAGAFGNGYLYVTFGVRRG